MVILYLSILGASIASALLPLINIEAILAVAVSQQPSHVAALVLAATVGQMVGKIAWYWGGREVDRAPWVHKHLKKPRAQRSLDTWHARAEGRPWFTAGLLFVSAFIGLPPYAVTAVLAGVLRVPFWIFLVTGFVGRGMRFAVVAAGMTSLLELW